MRLEEKNCLRKRSLGRINESHLTDVCKRHLLFFKALIVSIKCKLWSIRLAPWHISRYRKAAFKAARVTCRFKISSVYFWAVVVKERRKIVFKWTPTRGGLIRSPDFSFLPTYRPLPPFSTLSHTQPASATMFFLTEKIYKAT